MTAADVETKIFGLINTHVIPSIGATLASVINGQVYYEGQRPTNADTEDIVVSFASGIDGQFTNGVVMVNTYVLNQDYGLGDEPQRDVTRIRELSSLLEEWRDTLPVGDYWFQKDSTISSYPVPEVKQYYINLRIKFSQYGT